MELRYVDRTTSVSVYRGLYWIGHRILMQSILLHNQYSTFSRKEIKKTDTKRNEVYNVAVVGWFIGFNKTSPSPDYR